jgi:putative addiction module component (TIGR02574 family)
MPQVSASDFRHLSVDERLKLVMDLWDTIAADAIADPACLPVSDAQVKESLRRVDVILQDPSKGIPIDEALKRIERELERD